MESNFVDYVKIMCRSGKGGRGSMHLRHVKYNPNGGPDGGDGGKEVEIVSTKMGNSTKNKGLLFYPPFLPSPLSNADVQGV